MPLEEEPHFATCFSAATAAVLLEDVFLFGVGLESIIFLTQLFSAGTVLVLGTSGNVWRRDVTGISASRPEMLLSMVQCTDQPP